jgi:hypothetical protein
MQAILSALITVAILATPGSASSAHSIGDTSGIVPALQAGGYVILVRRGASATGRIPSRSISLTHRSSATSTTRARTSARHSARLSGWPVYPLVKFTRANSVAPTRPLYWLVRYGPAQEFMALCAKAPRSRGPGEDRVWRCSLASRCMTIFNSNLGYGSLTKLTAKVARLLTVHNPGSFDDTRERPIFRERDTTPQHSHHRAADECTMQTALAGLPRAGPLFRHLVFMGEASRNLS